MQYLRGHLWVKSVLVKRICVKSTWLKKLWCIVYGWKVCGWKGCGLGVDGMLSSVPVCFSLWGGVSQRALSSDQFRFWSWTSSVSDICVALCVWLVCVRCHGMLSQEVIVLRLRSCMALFVILCVQPGMQIDKRRFSACLVTRDWQIYVLLCFGIGK